MHDPKVPVHKGVIMMVFIRTKVDLQHVYTFRGSVSVLVDNIVCVWCLQRKDGTEKGPEALREGGLIKKLKQIGCDIKDYGDVDFEYVDDDQHEYMNNPRNVAHGSLKVIISIVYALSSQLNSFD